jgi:hypothetical protein
VSTGTLITLIAGGAIGLLATLYVLATRGPAGDRGGRVCNGCKRVMLPAWTKCLFCGWAPGARLEFILGPMASQTLPLADDVTTIGSVSGNSVVLADPAVSKKHAGIRKVDGNYELADLGSTNGVYVNGQKVPKKTLVVGDVIRVGNTEAVFRRD